MQSELLSGFRSKIRKLRRPFIHTVYLYPWSEECLANAFLTSDTLSIL